MAVHGTILARERRIRGHGNTGWSSANHNGANDNGTSCSAPNYNGANWVNINSTRVIPQPVFSWRPLRCRWWPNLD
jgi:hypothetical protein